MRGDSRSEREHPKGSSFKKAIYISNVLNRVSKGASSPYILYYIFKGLAYL